MRCAKQAVEIKLRNLDSKYKASHHVQMVLAHSGATNLPAHMNWQQKLFTGLERMHLMPDWVEDCSKQSRNATHLMTESLMSNSSLKVFVDSQHLSSQAWKGRLTNKLSLCFHSDLWMACASACDNQMPGKTRLTHKKPALCRKPVITAIIQLDLICIIKLCYCLALEATASPCSYQLDDGG